MGDGTQQLHARRSHRLHFEWPGLCALRMTRPSCQGTSAERALFSCHSNRRSPNLLAFKCHDSRDSDGGLREGIGQRAPDMCGIYAPSFIMVFLLVLQATCRARRSFLRRCFSPGSQRWQKMHETPLEQPFECMKAHGLHKPSECLMEPTVGTSGEPSAGVVGGPNHRDSGICSGKKGAAACGADKAGASGGGGKASAKLTMPRCGALAGGGGSAS